MIDISLIAATEEHHPLIYNSFIRSVSGDYDRRKNKRQRRPAPQFAQRLHTVAEKMLKEGRAIVADTGGLAIGWAIGGGMPPALHFVYVKRDFRRRGIGMSLVQELFPEGPLFVAHMTRAGGFFLDHCKRRVEALAGAWEE